MKIRIFAVVFLLCAGMIAAYQGGVADFSDDFEDGVIGSEWIISDYGGLNGTEVGGKLIVNGTYDPGETAPNTGGWNQFWMFYNESFTGFLDISVTNNITSYAGDEMSVGLGVIENTSVIWDNVTSWVQFNYTSGVNAVGEMHCWHDLSVVRTVFDSRIVTVGEAHTHRMVVHENKSIQLILDGTTKGWWNISYPQYYPFISVAMKYPGTTIEVELDDFILIADANPTAVLTPTSTNLDVGELVGFDGSQSSYGIGSIEAYSFDFGDGVTTGWIGNSFTTHTYAAEGSYNASLQVRADNGRESNWTTVTVCVDCAAPVVDFTVYPLHVQTLEPVWIYANDSSDADGTIVGYRYRFGDGTARRWTMEPAASHSYEDDGTYLAGVDVIDDDGHITCTSVLYIVTVDNRQPVALLDVVDAYVEVGETVYFDASDSYDLDGSVELYYFEFGDGAARSWGNTNVETHEYEDVGSYYATLRVRDNDHGDSEVAQVRITVTEAVDQVAEDYSWWVVILLLLIILLFVIVVLVMQWRLVEQWERPEEPPPTEGEPE